MQSKAPLSFTLVRVAFTAGCARIVRGRAWKVAAANCDEKKYAAAAAGRPHLLAAMHTHRAAAAICFLIDNPLGDVCVGACVYVCLKRHTSDAIKHQQNPLRY